MSGPNPINLVTCGEPLMRISVTTIKDITTMNSTPSRRERFTELGIKVHPAADLPMMPDAELDELAADIEKHGLRQAIDFQGDQLLDGRNRLAAIYRIKDETRRNNLLGAVASTKRVMEVPDPTAYVISANVRRRHLTPEQKRDIIAALLKEEPQRSDNATAKIANVSDKTVATVRRELEGRSEIPNVSTRTDIAGRRQPAAKPPRPRSKEAQKRELREGQTNVEPAKLSEMHASAASAPLPSSATSSLSRSRKDRSSDPLSPLKQEWRKLAVQQKYEFLNWAQSRLGDEGESVTSQLGTECRSEVSQQPKHGVRCKFSTGCRYLGCVAAGHCLHTGGATRLPRPHENAA